MCNKFLYLHLFFLAALVAASVQAQTVNYRINFSDQATTAPSGWLQDYGLPYGNQGGVTYGWVTTDGVTPLSLTNNGRNRPPSPDADVVTETFIHMQYSGNPSGGNSTEGIWQIVVPNGKYIVGVRVGDLAFNDSEHVLNAEGVNMLYFQQDATHRSVLVEKIIEVKDGKLTIDAKGGRNTKIAAVTLTNVIPTPQPFVNSSIPTNGQTNVSLTTTISANDISFFNTGTNGSSSVDNNTVNTNTTQLFEVNGTTLTRVPANVNGTAGGDAISLTPIGGLKTNTTYRYMINGVKDVAGYFLIPYTITFTTGAGNTTQTSLDDVAFTNKGAVATGAKYTSLVIGPDNKLYGLTITGYIHRWSINSDGTLSNREIINTLVGKYGERAAVGFAFDPKSTSTNLTAYISHASSQLENAPDWDGKLSRLTGSNLQTEQLLLTNLPRSVRDHLVNSIAFRPSTPNILYFIMSSNSAGGEPDGAWGNRPEQWLSASLLGLDLNKLPATLPLDCKTTTNLNYVNTVSVNSPKTQDGLYNPYYTDAPLKIYAAGLRNPYDLVFHSNGQIYIPTNGTAGGSNTPASIDGTRRPDGSFYNFNDPKYPQVPKTTRNETQRDWLFRVNLNEPLGYYGHPNPLQGFFVLNRGSQDVAKYPANTKADPLYRGAAFNFEFNKSPNGAVEYKNSSVFNSALTGVLLVVRYSNGDDIIALKPDGANGDIRTFKELIPGFTGFVDPLDLVEDTRNGNLYVAEYYEHQDGGKITLLTPKSVSNTNKAPVVTFESPTNGQNYNVGTNLYVKVNATDPDGSIQKVDLYLNDAFVRTETTVPYEWDSQTDPVFANMQRGTYTLRAVATDNQGKTAEQAITISVGNNSEGGDNLKPLVSFATPANNQNFPVGTNLYVKVDASDQDGSIKNVELYLNNQLVRRESVAPYEWGDPAQHDDPSLQNLQAGTYTLKAIATDNKDATSESLITITVGNSTGGGGNLPPVVVFEAPTDGQTFPIGTNLYVRVGATDDDGSIKQVDLYLNGQAVRREKVAPYEWGDPAQNDDPSLQNLQAGTYTLRAVATDNQDATSETTITITVGGNTPPSVSFAAPTNGQTFPSGSNVYVKVDAADTDGTVKQVDLYLNNTLVRTEKVAPYEWADPQNNDPQLQNMQPGSYTLKAVAIDDDNAQSEATIAFTIQSAGGGGGSTTNGEALPWQEPFTFADGTQNDTGSTSWKIRASNTLSGGSAVVSGNRFRVNGSSCDWFSGKIDVSQVRSVSISAQIEASSTLDPKDDIKMAYRIDGGSWILWTRKTGVFPLQTVSSVISLPTGAKTLEIINRVTKLEADETIFVDNINVSNGAGLVIENRTEIKLDDVFAEPTFALYPNPATGAVWVILDGTDETTVNLSVVDVAGKLIFEAEVVTETVGQFRLDTAKWAAGTYYLTAKTSRGEIYTEQLNVVKK